MSGLKCSLFVLINSVSDNFHDGRMRQNDLFDVFRCHFHLDESRACCNEFGRVVRKELRSDESVVFLVENELVLYIPYKLRSLESCIEDKIII